MKSLTTLIAALVLVTGCQNDQGTTPEASPMVEAAPAVFNAAGAPTASLYVPGMYCEFSCVEKVKQVLGEQAGVKEVAVDFKSKIVTVAIDPSAFNADGAVAALVDYQFMDSELITDEGEALASGVSTTTEATAVKVSYEK